MLRNGGEQGVRNRHEFKRCQDPFRNRSVSVRLRRYRSVGTVDQTPTNASVPSLPSRLPPFAVGRGLPPRPSDRLLRLLSFAVSFWHRPIWIVANAQIERGTLGDETMRPNHFFV